MATVYDIIQTVTPDAARHSSYRAGQWLVDFRDCEPVALALADQYNRNATIPGVTYSVEEIDSCSVLRKDYSFDVPRELDSHPGLIPRIRGLMAAQCGPIGVRDLRRVTGHADGFDAHDPMRNPVHIAIKALRDMGDVTVRQGDFGDAYVSFAR